MRDNTRIIFLIAASVSGAGTLASCGQDPSPLYIVRCADDAGCDRGEVCIEGSCEPREAILCQSVDDGRALIQPSLPAVDFEQVGSSTNLRSFSLRNIGNCALTIFDVFLAAGDASTFECPGCTAEAYPVELFPFREHALDVFFTPKDVGTFQDQLVIISDDAEFSEIRLPILAEFRGLPEIAAIPDAIDFDYTGVGSTRAQTIRIVNRGTGSQPATIASVTLDDDTGGSSSNNNNNNGSGSGGGGGGRGSAFSLAHAPTEAIELRPVAQRPEDALEVEVRYHPSDVAQHRASLVIRMVGQPTDVITIPVSGSSMTPASITVAPTSVRFGPVPIGQTTSQVVTIVNEGGAPLRVEQRLGGSSLSTDFSVTPSVLPPIEPGEYAELQVRVTATSPTPLSALLLLSTNDPSNPSVTVPISADGQEVVGAQVVKVEMTFENGDDSAFDDDLRNVDLTLENPFGQVCNKASPSPSDWGSFGSPNWMAFGPKEEPERVILPGAAADGVYRVILNYQEDCETIPTALLASVLGISIDALIAYLSGGAVDVDSGELAEAIDDLCLDRSGSTATITVYVNGEPIREKSVTLGRKGDQVYVLDLERKEGAFSAR
ncbi:MAG: choice-of-anchor D domain-containing protein [Deltaproteobacteria bacterium]|nr:choice-of-anchor D domain-containing protein [Deltaproteobacteria bacterium]